MWTPSPISPRTSSLNLLEKDCSLKSPLVTWLSPQENDMFGSWDILTAKWNSQQVLNSPAFRLCTLPDDSLQAPLPPSQNETEAAHLDNNCGSEISPTVEESDGSFLIRFTVPDITDDAFFLLQMNDASGAVRSSPIFKLSSHPIHGGARTRLLSKSNLTLETGLQRSPTTFAANQPPPKVGYTILLIFACLLLATAPLLWLYCHRKHVKMYFRKLRASQTSPALLQKIDPGDGTSVPIPVFMPTQRSRTPSQSRRQLFSPLSSGRASGIHQPLHLGTSRSFRLPSRYPRGSTYPTLPPISISSSAFIDEGDTAAMNSGPNNIHISRHPVLPPGLVSTPLRAHLRPSD